MNTYIYYLSACSPGVQGREHMLTKWKTVSFQSNTAHGTSKTAPSDRLHTAQGLWSSLTAQPASTPPCHQQGNIPQKNPLSYMVPPAMPVHVKTARKKSL
mmetsp:Transcript_21498/g.59533  ORF Transcript_21498/g.59533 Transcript_21498/m.59533 type:complete len:100 (-) Transcript_21498:1974-2273(-)